jgi:hypothetical protein
MFTTEMFEHFFLKEVRPLENEENAYIISRDTARTYKHFGEEAKTARVQKYMEKGDAKDIDKRFYVGTLGEKAVRCHLGLGEPDLSIDYDAEGHFKYHHMDLRNDGANVGIKSAKYPYTPMINPKDASEGAQIVCSVYPEYGLGIKVYVLGIVDSSDFGDAIDMQMKLETKNKFKGGFKGYNKLRPVPIMEMLRKTYPWAILKNRGKTVPAMVETLLIEDEDLFDKFMSEIRERSRK